MPPSYLSRSTLARELDVSESTVDEMVRRSVLPRPIRLSAGCVRWRWADVDMALASLGGVRTDPASDEAAARARRAIEASKGHLDPEQAAADGVRKILEASRQRSRPKRTLRPT